MQKLFSFILLTYKKFDGVIDTLDSVLAQDYPRIEIVISDDGSESYDEEIAKIKEYIERKRTPNIENVIYLHLDTNQGIVRNANNALRNTNGYYIKLLGAGDELANESTLSLYADYLERSGRNIVFGKLIGITNDGKAVRHLAACEEDYDKLNSMEPNQLLNRLYVRDCLPAPAWCAKKELFDKHGPFIEKTKLIEDYTYWLELCRNNEKIGFLDEVTIKYKLDGISNGGTYSTTFMEDMFIIYNDYIFPYDKRYGIIQPFYNLLKRMGLETYMAKAKWSEYSTKKRIMAKLKYGPFFLYIYLGNKIFELKNK